MHVGQIYVPGLPVGLSCDADEKDIIHWCVHVSSHPGWHGEERHIEYASKTLTMAERNYSQIEKEGLSIVFGLQKIRHYILGRKLLVHADHRLWCH